MGGVLREAQEERPVARGGVLGGSSYSINSCNNSISEIGALASVCIQLMFMHFANLCGQSFLLPAQHCWSIAMQEATICRGTFF